MPKILNAVRKQKIGFNKKVAYVTRAVRYNTIPYDDLVEMTASDSGISDAVVRSSLSAIFKQIKQMLLNGHTLKIGNLFYLRLGGSWKSVEDAEDISTDLCRRLAIKLIPTSALKTDLKNVVFETVIVDEEQP